MKKKQKIMIGEGTFQKGTFKWKYQYRENHIIVHLQKRDDSPDRVLQEIEALRGIEYKRISPPGYQWIYLRIDNADIFELMEKFKDEKDVLWAGPDLVMRGAIDLDDPYVPGNPLEQWGLECLNMFDAWDMQKEIPENEEPVIIGLLDSGVPIKDSILPGDIAHQQKLENCLTHPDLDGKRFIAGRNYFYDDNDDVAEKFWPQDQSGDSHGTKMAGIIAAKENNDEGLAGVNWKSDIYTCVVHGLSNGWGNVSTEGMVLSAAQEAAGYASANDKNLVINLCLCFPITSDFNLTDVVVLAKALYGLFECVVDAKAIICISAGNYFEANYVAGNQYEENPSQPYYLEFPALFGVQNADFARNLLVVGAVNKDLTLYSGTGRGEKDMVFAPGEDNATTFRENEYTPAGATSVAAAHVSALAALLWREDPDRPPEDIVACLKCTTREPSPGAGYRIVDAHAAFRALKGHAALLTGDNILFENVEPDFCHTRAIEIEVYSCQPVTLEVSVSGHPFGMIPGAYFHRPCDNPVFALEVTYAAGDDDEVSGTVSVKWVEKPEFRWEIGISASRG